MKTLIVGDVHCNWNHVHTLLLRERPDLVLQVGDFGYFPSFARGLPEPMGGANFSGSFVFCGMFNSIKFNQLPFFRLGLDFWN